MNPITEHQTEELYAVLLRFSKSLTGSGWDAQDLAQDSWMKASDALRTGGHANPEALLLRIARTTWIDQCRRKARLARILKSSALDPEGKPPELPWSLEEMFAALLKRLTGRQRSVWLLLEVLDYSIRETAELLGLTEGAVKSALHRARQMMDAVRQELSSPGGGSGPGVKARLEALSAAYRSGNVAALMQLLQEEELQQQAAQPIARRRGAARSGCRMRMAAATSGTARKRLPHHQGVFFLSQPSSSSRKAVKAAVQ